METLDRIVKELTEQEELKDETLKLFAKAFIQKKVLDSKYSRLGKLVAVQFDVSKIISAYMPLISKEYLGTAVSLKQLVKEFPMNRKIVIEQKVVEFSEASEILLQDLTLNEIVSDPQRSYRVLSKVSRKDGIKKLIDSRIIDKEKQLKNANRNYNYLMKNSKEITNHKFYKIVNPGHNDIDNCDWYIGRVFKKENLVRPPFHINCKCEVVGITRQEHDKLKPTEYKRFKNKRQELRKLEENKRIREDK